MSNRSTIFAGDGELRYLLRVHDWSASALGHPDTWPAPLKTAVSMMLDSALPMWICWGPSLPLLYNDAYAKILGTKHPDALAQPYAEVWREVWEYFNPLMRAALDGNPTFLENRELILHRDGQPEQTWFTYSISPLRDEADGIGGIFGTAIETTGHIAAERRQAAESERLYRLFEQAPGFMAVLRGPDHVYELVNNAMVNLIGQRKYVGLPVREAVPELEGQGYFELLDQVYQTGETYVGRGLAARFDRTATGESEERFRDFVYQPIIEADGKVSGVFVEGYDVTHQHRNQIELKELNTRLAEQVHKLDEADRRKDEFLAMLAHELRNPLAPISAAAELLSLPGLDETRIRRSSEIIRRQIGHITSLLEDLMDVSRVTRGLVSMEKIVLDVKNVVAVAVEQVKPLMEERKHCLAIHLAPEPAFIHGDHKRLVQLLTNLLSNAAKYTQNDGHIALRMEVTDSEVCLLLSDNGIGMTPAMLTHAFDLFAQAERTVDRSQGGLGIGLSLVKSLAEHHGGTVTAASNGIGKGTAFTVRLPRTASPAGEPLPQDDSISAAAVDAPLKVMIVDDNVDVARIMAMYLESVGHHIVVENDSYKALAIAGTEVPDVCLLDIGLPGMDGHVLVRRLRAIEALNNTIFVAVTGYGQPQDRTRALNGGFDHFFVKPINTKELLAVFAERQLGGKPA